MGISVPFYKQDTGYTCGPTSLQMVFSFFGSFMSEADLADLAETNEIIGTDHHNMIEVARLGGFYCYVNDTSSLLEVESFIDRGFPVIVDFVEPVTEEAHYAVVVGFSKGSIVLNDPANGKDFKLSEDDFSLRWHDGTTRSVRWMMVLSKSDFEIGRQYGPKI